jgi:hypothetical protein
METIFFVQYFLESVIPYTNFEVCVSKSFVVFYLIVFAIVSNSLTQPHFNNNIPKKNLETTTINYVKYGFIFNFVLFCAILLLCLLNFFSMEKEILIKFLIACFARYIYLMLVGIIIGITVGIFSLFLYLCYLSYGVIPFLIFLFLKM